MKNTCSICKRNFEGLPAKIALLGSKTRAKIYCSVECIHKDAKPKHKFKAVACESDGIRFASKAERSYYQRLKIEQKNGEVLFFLRQVPLHLPGNTKYVVDYQVFKTDGTVEFIDVKGVSTPMFKLKKKQVEDIYPIEIKVVQ